MSRESLKGKLLVSTPVLFDPNFRRTVVLVGEHGDEGAMGLVLNRPSETTVGEAVPDLAAVAGPDSPVFVGGPVQTGRRARARGVRRSRARGRASSSATSASRERTAISRVLGESTRRARVFAGYSGWGPGQLEAELEEDVVARRAGRGHRPASGARRGSLRRRPAPQGRQLPAARDDARGSPAN